MKKIKVKKLKTKRRKKPHKIRKPEFLCPNCMSTLIMSKDGKLRCSGDRFKIWEKEFEKYSKMNKNNKIEYKKNIEEKDKFDNLYNKWLSNDMKNACDYSNKLFFPVNRIKTEIHDPIKTRATEKDLKRKLTKKELSNISKINLPDDV